MPFFYLRDIGPGPIPAEDVDALGDARWETVQHLPFSNKVYANVLLLRQQEFAYRRGYYRALMRASFLIAVSLILLASGLTFAAVVVLKSYSNGLL